MERLLISTALGLALVGCGAPQAAPAQECTIGVQISWGDSPARELHTTLIMRTGQVVDILLEPAEGQAATIASDAGAGSGGCVLRVAEDPSSPWDVFSVEPNGPAVEFELSAGGTISLAPE